MIKLKDILKESTWGNRKFGEPLPTMEDYKKAYEDKHEPEEGPKEPKTKIPENPFDDELSEGKADQSFNKIMGLLRKESRRLNDDDSYELSTKLKKWFNKNILEGNINELGGFSTPGSQGLTGNQYTAPKRDTSKGDMKAFLQKFSSKEAKNIVDGSLKNYVKDLRKVEGRIVKDWMSAAKSGQIDFFDIIRGLKTGDVKRAHPYEMDFFVDLLTRNKIVDRFRSYFKGKKGKLRK